jgi:signal transduction histidine kinase
LAAVGGLVLLAVGTTVHAAIVHPDAVAQALLGGTAVPWTVGRIVRSNRRRTGEERERIAQAEQSRARRAQAAVTSERMRVARELHDAVAHNISVIAIQAAGADGIVDRDPERAAQCAALIESVGREALTELDRLRGPQTADEAAPQPSLARVEELAQRTRDGGLPVDVHVEGEPAALPAGLDLAAYRIVQEALANASKHAGGTRAAVVVRYRPHTIELEIADDGGGPNDGPAASSGSDRGPSGGPAAPTGSGHGLIGMRERVALYGGTLDVGERPGGGFAVHARLPRERA